MASNTRNVLLVAFAAAGLAACGNVAEPLLRCRSDLQTCDSRDPAQLERYGDRQGGGFTTRAVTVVNPNAGIVVPGATAAESTYNVLAPAAGLLQGAASVVGAVGFLGQSGGSNNGNISIDVGNAVSNRQGQGQVTGVRTGNVTAAGGAGGNATATGGRATGGTAISDANARSHSSAGAGGGSVGPIVIAPPAPPTRPNPGHGGGGHGSYGHGTE